MRKGLTEDYLSFTAWQLLRYVRSVGGTTSGSLKWTFDDGSTSGISYFASLYGGYIDLSYKIDGRPVSYRVEIRNTPCHFGGFRFWFTCPLICNGQRCGRRVGILYLNGDYFGCRHCHEIAYRSQYERRDAFTTLLRSYELLDEIDQLDSLVKRRTYRGRLTKKQRKLERLGDLAVSTHRKSLMLHFTKELVHQEL